MKWRVCKTVTEYHYFVVEAESEQRAIDMVSDDDEYYCDSGKCESVELEVQFAEEVA